MDLECALVRAFGWSLHEIEQTDTESLLRFIEAFPRWQQGVKSPKAVRRRMVYADQFNWPH